MAHGAVAALEQKRPQVEGVSQAAQKAKRDEAFRRLIVSWSLAAGVLFGAGLAAQALMSLMPGGPPFAWTFLEPLAVFSVGGGLAVAALRVAAGLVARSGALVVAILVVVLWGLIIWPTPFKYRVVDKQLYKINRVMGSVQPVPHVSR
jgi:hypothetical protein